MSSPLQQTIEKIQRIHEVEYGDFKRKVGQYLNSLSESVTDSRRLAELKQRVVFNPDADIEKTRRYVVSELRQLSR